MTQLHERDMMRCRACDREERASEGYPCADCGTFICIICHFQGVSLCAACAAKPGAPPQPATRRAPDPFAGPPTHQPPSRPTAEPPSDSAAEPPSRPADQPPTERPE